MNFATRIALHFGVLFLAALGSLALLWYVGLPGLGVVGAGEQRLREATRLLELSASQQRDMIRFLIEERRGDALVVAENRVLAEQLKTNVGRVQATIEREFDRLQRAYPDVYLSSQVVDAHSRVVLASSNLAEVGAVFAPAAVLERALQPGMTELIEQVPNGQLPGLAIVRQIFEPDGDGYHTGNLLGVLILRIDVAQLIERAISIGREGLERSGRSLIFDAGGQLLVRLAQITSAEVVFRRDQRVVHGFEGTLMLPDDMADELIVVYRHVPLGGSQGWTLVHFQSRHDALAALKGSVQTLIFAGLLLTVVSLLFIGFGARHLTRPLKRLTYTTRQFDSGHLSVRAQSQAGDSRELVELSEAFNGMATGIEQSHHVMESKVRERTLALARERDVAQSYLDIAAVMLMVLDRSGRIAMINRKGVELLGRPVSALLGQDWFGTYLPAQEQEMVRQVFQTFMTDQAQAPAYFESCVINASGQVLVMAWHNTVLRDDEGRPTGTLSSAEDITGRRQAQTALESANRELARSNAELEQFAYVASHDLQEPLRSVSSCVQLLKKRYGGTLDERADEFIAHAVGGSQRMQALIDDLLAYSKVSAAPRTFAATDSLAALNLACANLAHAIDENRAQITHGSLPTVNADAAQLVQLLQNLIGNALKFHGNRPAVVHVDARQEGDDWLFSVADQGIGIEPRYFDRIFRLFQRLHTREEYAGTGIGLTICHKIVERHGGRIWLASEVGLGTTFYFTLPGLRPM